MFFASRFSKQFNVRTFSSKPFSAERKTSIITTLGPSCSSESMIRQMLLEGANCMRVNFSHGSFQDKSEVISTLRRVLQEFRDQDEPIDWSDGSNESACAILADLKGPEIRTGNTLSSDVMIQAGENLEFTTNIKEANECRADKIFVDYEAFCSDLAKAQASRPTDQLPLSIFVDDGLLQFEVVDIISDSVVKARAVNSGPLSSKKGVNLPGVVTSLPSVTERDKKDIAFAVKELRVDYVAASFVRRQEHVEELRTILNDLGGSNVRLISKIENQEGLDNYPGILEASDGVMVARGDLGIEVPVERVFSAQKNLIRQANLAGKLSICATQMLESLRTNPRPTRAEVSDVGNAVLDGCDSCMLSGETASGRYPLKAIRVMSQVVREAETMINYPREFALLERDLSTSLSKFSSIESLAFSTVAASFKLNAPLIIVHHRSNNRNHESGRLCRHLARFRPRATIVLVCEDQVLANQVSILRGVQALVVESTSEQRQSQNVAMAIKFAKDMGVLQTNDPILLAQMQSDLLPNGELIHNPTMKITNAL